MRLLQTFAYLIAAVTTATSAQTPAPGDRLAETSRQLLQSTQLRDKAWGIFLGSRLHTKGMHHVIVSELRAVAGADFREATELRAYVQTLLDALIESEESAGADVLLPLAAYWGDEVLILLARGKVDGIESELLKWGRRSIAGPEWLAVSNLLFGMRSVEFRRNNLEEIEITHEFLVHDIPTRFGIGDGGSVSGRSPVTFPVGFPPVAVYRLELYSSAGLTVAVAGPHEVFFRRIAIPADGHLPELSTTGLGGRQESRLQYLAELAGVPMIEVRRIFMPQDLVQWRSAATVSRDEEKLLNQQAASILSLIERAKNRGLRDVAGMRLRIVSTVIDRVKAPHAPLRRVAIKEFVIP